MRIVSWNINGLRSFVDKGGDDYLLAQDLDIICLQETRCSQQQYYDKLAAKLSLYMSYNSPDPKKYPGRNGVAVLSREQPEEVLWNLIDYEDGRSLLVVYKDFILLNIYSPNSGRDFGNLEKRLCNWEKPLIKLINKSQDIYQLPIICVGDLNVAPCKEDRYNVTANWAGCSDEESQAFSQLLEETKLYDSYRSLHRTKGYTWRMSNSRLRIDYILCNSIFQVQESRVHRYCASDHYALETKLKPR